MSDASPRPFRVHYSQKVRLDLIQAVESADRRGGKEALIADAKVVDAGLKWYADEFGESRWPAGELGEVRFAQIGRLAVWYAVHRERWDVTISSFGYVSSRS
jgi:hypothetical protein